MRQFSSNLVLDLRFALRQIGKQWAFSLTAVIVFALGISSSTAVFSVLYQILLKPLPYPNAQQLLFVHNLFPKSQVSTAGVSGFDYASIKRRKDLFSDAGVFYWNDLILTGYGSARHLNVVNASASVFRVLDVKPELGRTFSNQEDQNGAAGTVVLSHDLWRNTFQGDPRVLGRNVYLNGAPYTVVGVMPRKFQFPSRETQLWIPVAVRPGEFTIQGGRLEKWLHMVARLAPGVSMVRATEGLQAVSNQLGSVFPAFYPQTLGWRFAVRQMADEQTESIRRWLYLAFGAVASVLLISCINVSGLLLIRGTARTGEVAVRRAIGASKQRIIWQMLTETSVVVVVSCGFGLVVATWLVHLVNLYGPLNQPVRMQLPSLLFAISLAAISTVVAGLAPARLIAGLPVEQALKGGATRTATKNNGVRYAIVAAQIACAVGIIFTASQLSRSFLNLSRVPAGFERAHIWTGAITLPSRHYTVDQSWNTQFFEPLLRSLAALPGVQSVSSGNAIPFNPSGVWTEALRLPGHPKLTPAPEAQIGLVFPRYFETMGIPLREGRTFTERDRHGATPVAVIDEELARRYFPHEDPVGQLIGSGGGTSTAAHIIGVVRSVHNSDLGGPREPEVYYPELQERTEAMYLVLRLSSDLDPSSAVRKAIAGLDPDVALYDVQTMENRVADSLRLRRFIAFLLNGMAMVGLVLAVTGLYASLAHLVALRRREIGIRVALGAMRSQVVRMVLARAAVVVVAGVTVGAVAGALAGQAVRSQLFGVRLTDLGTWAGVLGVVLIASLISAALPAWRAARVEPAEALRSE